MKQLPQNYFVALGARWAAVFMVIAILWHTGMLFRLDIRIDVVLALGYILAYVVLWTLLASRFWIAMRDGIVLILYDLFLSALPVWFSGGWASPFLPFALSALIVPALGPGWQLGVISATALFLIDQVILWTTSSTPWQLIQDGQSVELAVRALLPFGVVLLVSSGAALERRWRLRIRSRRRAMQEPHDMDQHTRRAGGASERGGPVVGGVPAGATESSPVAAWKSRGGQPTLERRSLTSIEAVVRQSRPELETSGVRLQVSIQGDERQLPKQIRQLLVRVIEAALENIVVHAHAREAEVSVRIYQNRVHLQIVDDGIGLFDGTAEPPGFRQLKRLRYRTHELGGELQVEERPEGGVLLWWRVPFGR